MKPTRVVLADDHTMVRKGIRLILERAPGIEVVGEASNGIEAVDCVIRHDPDVLVLDMEMPELDGLGVVRHLAALRPDVRILVLSAHTDKHFVQGVLEYGMAGYLAKDEAPEKVVDAIRRVAAGSGGFFSERVINAV